MKEITKALIKARKNFKPVRFDRDGARNSYATYGAISDAVTEALNEQGINMSFRPETFEGRDYLTVMLTHTESDEIMKGFQPLFNDAASAIKDENQRYVASTTYAMRNLARTMLGLHADTADIDDFNHGLPARALAQEGHTEGEPMATEKQLKFLKKLLADHREMEAETTTAILSRMGCDSIEELTQKQASQAIKILKPDTQ